MKMIENENVLRLAKSIIIAMKRLASITFVICIPVEIIGFYMIYKTLFGKLMFSLYITIYMAMLFAIVVTCTKVNKDIDDKIDSLENKLKNN